MTPPLSPFSIVSPASRGIGFALTRHILQTTNAPVVATTRKNLTEVKEKLLNGLDVNRNRLHVLACDVLDESSISSAASECASLFPPSSGHRLRLAYIVPGILFPEKAPKQINADDALLTFRTNTLGPMLMLKHFERFLPTKQTQPEPEDAKALEGLPTSAVMAIMSARVGSISDNKMGGWYSYRASKAALNQVAKTFDNYLRTKAGENAMCISMHPGTVKTEFSQEFWGNVREGKLFEPEFAAEKLVGVVRERSREVEASRGRCWDWEGKEVPP